MREILRHRWIVKIFDENNLTEMTLNEIHTDIKFTTLNSLKTLLTSGKLPMRTSDISHPG